MSGGWCVQHGRYGRQARSAGAGVARLHLIWYGAPTKVEQLLTREGS